MRLRRARSSELLDARLPPRAPKSPSRALAKALARHPRSRQTSVETTPEGPLTDREPERGSDLSRLSSSPWASSESAARVASEAHRLVVESLRDGLVCRARQGVDPPTLPRSASVA